MLLCIILGVTGSGMKALSTTLEYSWKELETRNPGVYHSYIAKFSLVLFQLCSFSKSGTVLRQGPGSYSKKICITKSLSSTALGPPTQVEDGNVRLNTRFLEHRSVASPVTNQKKSHTPWSPHPKCCFLFLGTSDDHSVRSPVWPLSISSLRGANSFKLNCCYYKVNAGFRHRIPQLRSGRERLLLC